MQQVRVGVSVVGIMCAAVLVVPGAAVADPTGVVSPGCDASLQERSDWAQEYDAARAAQTARVDDTPTEAQLGYYTALELCSGEVIHQSGDTLRGPKASGDAPPASFQPSGRVSTTSKRKRGRSARTLTCSNTAFDPAFSGGNVRASGRSSCNTSASLSVTTCVGRYFQSTGNTDQVVCKNGGVFGPVITVTTDWHNCSPVVSYRSNFYGQTGNAFSFYFNGGSFGCV
jgi:hypothetical protein